MNEPIRLVFEAVVQPVDQYIEVVATTQSEEIEIAPCRNVDSDTEHSVQVCAPEHAEFWGVYRRPKVETNGGRPARWVCDAPTRQSAESLARQLSQAA